MNISSQLYGWLVMAIVLVFPMPRAEAVPPGGAAQTFLEMQTTLEEISQQIKGLLRVSSIQNVSGVSASDTIGIDTLEINITTTEEGPFVIMFTAVTLLNGLGINFDKGYVRTRILLDDAHVTPEPLLRSESPAFIRGDEISWTVTVANVQPGEHLVKINLSCDAVFVSNTCLDLDIEAALGGGAQLTVIRPM